ncbi:gustatory receptor for sugar taste 61a-like [Anopheles funestus]|uniref:gustatory receptor for sugar taste 61a-like n=1 Tax=Anopheles funestus TaxID=62324 RepID=UPI0020C5DAB3|nr:gustatory receptor for sugar taste 61a-like [Anopheles funestus]
MVVVYLSAWLFFFVAIQWQSILDAFANCERSFMRDHYRLQSRGRFNLVWKIRFTGFAIFALAMVEDWLNYYSAYQSNIVQIATCNRTNVTVWQNFYLREHPHIFHWLPFNWFTIAVTEVSMAVLLNSYNLTTSNRLSTDDDLRLQWINRCMRYTWTYLDIFIISFCYGAQFRYEQIFRRLVAVQGLACPTPFWHELRMDYVAVSELVNVLDTRFGHLILLACANDMYFIATQLFNGFQRRKAIANYVYFWYSLLLLMFRTIVMLYVGSGVYVASTSPLQLLRNVSSKNWGIDLQRLTDEVSSGENVLSGKQFFFLKRQLILALFSLFPLSGLYGQTLQDIRFRWYGPGTIYSFYFLLSGLITLTAHIYYSVNVGNLGTPEINFYSLGCVKYPQSVLNFSDQNLYLSVEDTLHVASVYYTNLQYYKRCDNSTPFWTLFYEREHPKFFHYLPYSLPAVLLLELTHKIFLYVWTFMDLFIIFVALGLARRYEQFYRHAVRYKGRHVMGTIWQQLRLDYGRISNLVAYMESIMAPIIICTTASDLYFIFYQMFNSFQFSASLLSEVYFKFSLAFLIFRTLAMLLIASNIHVTSLRPLDILRSTPMSCWTIDVQRFTQELLTSKNCLSGYGFFFLNRSVILAMAGTLITYELVMLKEVPSAEKSDFCEGGKRLY